MHQHSPRYGARWARALTRRRAALPAALAVALVALPVLPASPSATSAASAASVAPAVATCTLVSPAPDSYAGDAVYLRANCTGAVRAYVEMRPAGSADAWSPLGEVGPEEGFSGQGDAGGFAQGMWEVRVRGLSDTEVLGPPSPTRTMTLDRVAPFGWWGSSPIALDGSSTIGPGSYEFFTLSNDTAPQIGECRVRPESVAPANAPWTSCGPSGPGIRHWRHTFVPASSGVHFFEQRVSDAAGNRADFTPIRMVVDLDGPVVTIGGPAEGASVGTGEVGLPFSADEPAAFTCRVVAPAATPGAFGPCTSADSHTASGLADGTHAVTVRAVDGFGNASETTRTFTVDTLAPTLALTGGPAAGATLTRRAATFTFAADDPAASYSCRVRRGTSLPAYTACTGSGTHVVGGLGDGAWTFEVRASDAAGNTATATRSFAVDATAPVTRVAKRPAAKVRTAKRTATVRFRFAADEVATYRCRLDGGAWRACGERTRLKVRPGRHRLEVVAVDRHGTADASPAVVRWRVIRR